MMLANNFPSDLDSSGQTITFDEKTEFTSHVEGVESIKDITADTSLEVQGYNTASGSFYATHIIVNKAVTSTRDVLRVRGIIETLSYSSFRVGRLDVYFDHLTIFVNLDSRIILPGMAVVIVGAFEDETRIGNTLYDNSFHKPLNNSYCKKSNRIFHATSIEVLNLDVLDNDHVEMEGFIGTNGVSNEKFSINNMTVQFTAATLTRYGDLSKLIAGVKVEVSGVVDRQGILVAENIDIEQQQNYSITGAVEAISCRGNSFSGINSSEDYLIVMATTVMATTVMATMVAIDGDPNNKTLAAATSLLKSTLAKLATHDCVSINFHKNTDTELYVLDSVEQNSNWNGLARVTGPISSVYNHGEITIITIAGVRTRIAMALLESTETELRPGLILELYGRYCSTEAVFHVNDYSIKD